MKKNVINEISQMKFLFGYKPGKVLSEQNMSEMGMDFEMDDDIVMSEPDVMEPEVKPDTDRDVEERPSRPGRPDRDPSRLPYTDPDTHPQGEYEDEIEYELEIDDVPRMDRPMGRMSNMGMDRPMGGRNRNSDETEYEIEIDGDIEDLF